MQAIGALITIIVTFYAYQWGVGHKKQPNGAVVFVVMALSVITTVPAYFIGRNNREVK